MSSVIISAIIGLTLLLVVPPIIGKGKKHGRYRMWCRIVGVFFILLAVINLVNTVLD